MVWLGRNRKEHLVPTPCKGRDTLHQPRMLRAPSIQPWAVPGMTHPQFLCPTCSWDLLLWGQWPLHRFPLRENRGKSQQQEGHHTCLFSSGNEKEKVNEWDLGLLCDGAQPPVSASAPSSYLRPALSISESLEIRLHLLLADGEIVYHRQGRQGSAN